MKLFAGYFEKKIKNKIDKINNLNLSLFIDHIPKSEKELSQINVMVLMEPNQYFGIHSWTIQNQNLFQIILTWDDMVLNNCKNAVFLPFGYSWFKPEQYKQYKEKKFEIAHLSGILNKTYGHSMRHEIIARQNEFKIPINFHKTIGDRHDEDDARIGKETVFGNSQFGIAIENFSHRGFFTEKIIDCFLMRTIPIYWGCSNIGDYFNIDGIIRVENVDDIIHECNISPEWYYALHDGIIEENYQKALQYINYEQNIINKVEEIFKLNKLI